LKMVRQ